MSLVGAQSSSEISSLPSDTSDFVPSCALPCLLSFAQANYAATVCSTTPSLDCLCSNKGDSGFTFGEGALQCIISCPVAGPCQGVNSNNGTLLTAYRMCDGRPDALPNLAKTISATGTPTSSLSATSVFSSSSIPSVTSNSGFSTQGPTSSFFTTTATVMAASIIANTTQAVSQVSQGPTASSTNLTTSQLAGIIGGVVGVVALAIVAIILLACVRRQRLANRYMTENRPPNRHRNSMNHYESGSGRASLFRSSIAQKFGIYKPGGTSNGVAAKVPPVPKRVLADFNGSNHSRTEIGKALFPADASQSEPAWEHSNLSPENPASRLIVPAPRNSPPQQDSPQSALSYQVPSYYYHNPQSSQPTNNAANRWRASSTTMFEEDGAAPHELKGPDPGYKYPLPNKTLRFEKQNSQTFSPEGPLMTDPGAAVKPANTYLMNQRTPSPNQPLTGVSMVPNGPDDTQRNQTRNGLATQPRTPPGPGDSLMMPSRDIMSAAMTDLTVRPLNIPRKPPPAQAAPSYKSFPKALRVRPSINVQDQYFTGSSENGTHNSNNHQSKSKKYYGQNPRARNSVESVTSIESMASPEPELYATPELSPVVESPVQRSLGRSPVAYPKIRNSPGISPTSLKRPLLEPGGRVERSFDQEGHRQKFLARNDNISSASPSGARPPPHPMGAANYRARHPNPPPSQYDDLPSQQKTNRTRSQGSEESSSSQLAQRRGAKLASPLKLEPSQPRGRRALARTDSLMDAPVTPAGMMKLTPKRIGDELFLE